MKKQIIAAAIAAAVAAPAAMAGAPTVYGQINMSVDSVKDNGISIGSNASRIGVKGSEDLGNGLKAIYKIELGVDIDGDSANNATTFKTAESIGGRNAYLGLAGGFGAVLLGRHDTPMKMSQAKDLFNDGPGDLSKVAGGLGVQGSAGEVRAPNVVAYVSPSFNGVKIVVAGVAVEGAVGSNPKDSSVTNALSAAAMYGSKKKGLYAAVAYNTLDKKVFGADATEVRVSAQYKAGPMLANVMYQDFDKTGADGSNIQVNLGYDVGAAMLKAKYSMVDYKSKAQSDGSAYAVGVDYALGKKTSTYVEYVALDKDLGDTNTLSVGLVHKF